VRRPPVPEPPAPQPWWRGGVLYQIYPRSFADSNGDGTGDLRGIIEHLDHLQWLGVDGIWLSPITLSPDAEWGYDVSDFCAVHPELGTTSDLDELIVEARRRGIRVLLDLVPNHTSNQHPWFVDSCSSRSARHRDWYVWADGSPPNNWVSSFGGPAWTFDDATGQSYLHNHLSEQPDLNWWNEEVRDAFDAILAYWFDRGIAGFRIDVCNGIVKDAELRDNPRSTPEDTGDAALYGQRFVYNANRPEVHDVIRRWRRLADAHEAVLIGETPVESMSTLASFYGAGDDELHLAFNFPFITAPLDADAMRTIVERAEAALPPGAWPAWTGSNHDMSRLATRWAQGDKRKIRAALVVLLGLRGTPVLYQGDEIGLVDTPLARVALRDPLGVRFWPAFAGRYGMRTPMHWSGAVGGGFTAAAVTPWLPLGDLTCNVEDQRADPASILTLTRDLIALRKDNADLASGAYVSLAGPSGVWAWRRGGGTAVVVNLSESDATLDGISGRVSIGTNRTRDGEYLSGPVALSAWEALVVQLASP